MKRKLLFLSVMCFLSFFVRAQVPLKQGIKPAPQTNLLSKPQSLFNEGVPRALVCQDTLRYPQVKEQILGASNFFIFELWTADAEFMSQAYMHSGTAITINGIEFFGRRSPAGPATVTVRASIYNVNAGFTPTTMITSANITISDTNYQYRNVTFGTPISVTGNYAVVIEPISTNGIVQFYVNNAAPAQPYDENFARVRSAYYPNSNNGWVSVTTLTTGDITNFPGGPYNFEALVAPRVSYNINTSFIISSNPVCAGTPVTFTNTTSPTSILTNRMMTFTAFESYFLSYPDSTYVWDTDGISPLIWSSNTSFTYNTPNVYNPTLYTLGGFWHSCLDNQANSLTVNGPPAAPGAISGNTSICGNTSQTYSINPVTGATSYTWTTPSGWTGTSTSNTINVTSSASGGNITVTANNNCGSSSAVNLSVTVNLDNANFNYPTTTICTGSPNQTPTVSSAGTFSSTPAGLVFVSNSTGEINMGASAVGVYNVTYNTSGTCPNSSSQTITITNSPDATFSYSSPAYCTNGTNPSPVFGMGASAGIFSSTAGLSISTSTGIVNLSASTPGSYTVTNFIAASGACSATSATANIIIHALPIATISGGGTVCAGNNASVNISLTGTGPWSFTYTDGTTPTTINNHPASIFSFTTSTAGTYTVTSVSDANCSNTGSGFATVTVNQLPNVSLAPFSQICVYNPAFSLSGGSPAGGTYSGTGVSGGNFNPSNAGIGTHAITYTFTDGNGCTNSAVQNIIVDACLGMNENSLEHSLLIAPNPAKDNFVISFTAKYNSQINIYSIDGKLVYTDNIAAGKVNKPIETSRFNKAIYFVQIVSNNEVINKKIVIE